MENFADRLRFLIREALSEHKEYSKNGFVVVNGTKGIEYDDSIKFECTIYVDLAEHAALKQQLVNNGMHLQPKLPPGMPRKGGDQYVKFTNFNSFLKSVEEERSIRDFLRMWSPHHGPYNQGVFPSLVRQQWEDFVEFWRGKGYSTEGVWPEGIPYHDSYSKECKYCRSRLKGGWGELHARGTGHPLIPAAELSKKRIKELVRDGGAGGFCCGDPVKPARIYEDLAAQEKWRAGQAELGKPDAELMDQPGAKTREFLQYSDFVLMLTIMSLYKKDVLKVVKDRIGISPNNPLYKHIYGENDQNLTYKKPKRKFIKKTRIPPTHLQATFFKPPAHVRLDGNKSYREYRVEVILALNPDKSSQWQEYWDIIDNHSEITSDPVEGARLDLEMQKKLKKHHEKYLDPKPSFLDKLEKLIRQKQQDENNHFEYEKPYKSPDGYSYTVYGLKTGLSGLNFLIDSFMPFKKGELETRGMDSSLANYPDVDDDLWSQVGRGDRLMYESIKLWFGEFDFTLAPWQQDSPFPIDSKGNIYYLRDDDIVVLDINKTVEWGKLHQVIGKRHALGPKERAPSVPSDEPVSTPEEREARDMEYDRYSKQMRDQTKKKQKQEQAKEGPEKSSERRLRTPDRGLSPYPKIRGNFQQGGQHTSSIRTIPNGCEVIRSLTALARKILLEEKITLVNEAAALLTNKLPSVAPELVKLANQCVPGSSSYNYITETLAGLGLKGGPEDKRIRSKSHDHIIVNDHIAWDDKASAGTNLIIDLDAGEYWLKTKLQSRRMARGTQDWYLLNIKRLKNQNFVWTTSKGETRNCSSCKGEGCQTCEGTGKKLVSGVKLISRMVKDFQNMKTGSEEELKWKQTERILGKEFDPARFEKSLPPSRKKGKAAKGSYKTDIALRSKIMIEKRLLQSRVEGLIKAYDLSIINPGTIYRFDTDSKQWISYDTKKSRKSAARSKVKYVEYGDTMGLDISSLSHLDRVALYMNWSRKSPISTISSEEDAVLADLWDNVLAQIRTGDFYNALGLPRTEEEKDLAYTDENYRKWLKSEEKTITIKKSTPPKKETEYDENVFNPGGVEEEGWDDNEDYDDPENYESQLNVVTRLAPEIQFQYHMKLKNYFLLELGYSLDDEGDIITPDQAQSLGFTTTEIAEAQEAAKEEITGDIEDGYEDDDYGYEDEEEEDY